MAASKSDSTIALQFDTRSEQGLFDAVDRLLPSVESALRQHALDCAHADTGELCELSLADIEKAKHARKLSEMRIGKLPKLEMKKKR